MGSFPGVIHEIGAYWRNNLPGGLGVRLSFEQDPAGAERFSRSLLESLHTYDQHTTREEIEAQLAEFGALKPLSQDHATSAVHHVFWLQARGHLATDDVNGVIWHCSVGRELVLMEHNPFSIDWQATERIKLPLGPGDPEDIEKVRRAIDRARSRGKPS